MTSLITGACGFVGATLARRLQARGEDLVLHARGGDMPADGRAIRLDLARDSIAPQLLAHVDTIFHCAGIAHTRADETDYMRVNVEATLRLAADAAAAGVGHFIFLSSVRADPGGGPYGRSKWLAEEGLREQLVGQGMAVSIVRPTLVFGPGVRGNLALLARAVRAGLPVPPEGEPRAMIAVDDLAEALCVLGAGGAGSARHYVLADGQRYTLGRLYRALRTAAGKSAGNVRMPDWCWRFACGALDRLRNDGDEGLYQRMFAADWHEDERFGAEFSWSPERRFEDDAAAILAQATR